MVLRPLRCWRPGVSYRSSWNSSRGRLRETNPQELRGTLTNVDLVSSLANAALDGRLVIAEGVGGRERV